jgi:hypothetical protein
MSDFGIISNTRWVITLARDAETYVEQDAKVIVGIIAKEQSQASKAGSCILCEGTRMVFIDC